MVLPATLPDPERKSPGAWHCPTCAREPREGGVARAVRLKMHCGYLPRAEWPPGRGRLPLAIGDDPYTHDTCPGWVARQPDVAEAARLHMANEKGILDRIDPGNRRVVNQAVLLASRAFGLHQDAKLKRMRKA